MIGAGRGDGASADPAHRQLAFFTEREGTGVSQVEFSGATLREVRKGKSLTLAQLGEIVDVTESGLAQFERGVARPRMTTLCRIAQALEIQPGELFEAVP